MNGHDYRNRIGQYIAAAFAHRGLAVYSEVNLGTSILGRPRRIDLLVIQTATNTALAIECKYQDTTGTADEKIPYTLQDLASMQTPAAIAYAGQGFSDGVLHLLQSSHRAAYCLPGESQTRPSPAKSTNAIDDGTWQLDHIIAQTFGWWDIVLGKKSPISVGPSK